MPAAPLQMCLILSKQRYYKPQGHGHWCAGAFDSFGYKRSSFFLPGKSGDEFIEELVKYGDLYKNDTFSAAGSFR